MTMVPAQNLFIKHNNNNKHGSYGGCEGSYKGTNYEYYSSEGYNLGADLVLVDGNYMAEDESRSSSVNNDQNDTSSKDLEKEKKDERWLQLGLGSSGSYNNLERFEPRRRSELVELDLLTTTPNLRSLSIAPSNHIVTGSSGFNSNIIGVPLLLQQARTSSFSSFPPQHQQVGEVSWGCSSSSWNAMSSSSLMMSPWNNMMCYSSQPFHHPYYTGGHGVEIGSAGPSSDMRVIDAPPPSRQINSGVWFVLQASSNQAKEPFLPQIPKSYLRIKDGRMTVGLVMKYLVNKLKLNSESEIEITCRGLQLLPFFTLLHVRDTIWSSSRDHAVTLLSDSSTTDHLMILCYGRSAY